MMILIAAICVLAVGANAQVGPGGIVSPDGVNTQFTHEFANDIVLIGPSGIVTKTGGNRQLTHGEATLHAAAPAAPAPVTVPAYVQKGAVGPSGIVKADGNNIQFTHEQADNIVLIGPSGYVSKDGNNMQFTDDIAGRAKRATVGASGMILPDGTPIQFTEPGVTILLEGPSGYIMSNGQLFQKRSKRSPQEAVVGASGIITPKGDVIQLPAGVTVASAGPSGVVLSNGENIQY